MTDASVGALEHATSADTLDEVSDGSPTAAQAHPAPQAHDPGRGKSPTPKTGLGKRRRPVTTKTTRAVQLELGREEMANQTRLLLIARRKFDPVALEYQSALEQRKTAIRSAYRAGMSARMVGDLVGISRQAVEQLCADD